MRDLVRYALPLGPLRRLMDRLFVRRDLEAIFARRSRTVNALYVDQIEMTNSVQGAAR